MNIAVAAPPNKKTKRPYRPPYGNTAVPIRHFANWFAWELGLDGAGDSYGASWNSGKGYTEFWIWPDDQEIIRYEVIDTDEGITLALVDE